MFHRECPLDSVATTASDYWPGLPVTRLELAVCIFSCRSPFLEITGKAEAGGLTYVRTNVKAGIRSWHEHRERLLVDASEAALRFSPIDVSPLTLPPFFHLQFAHTLLGGVFDLDAYNEMVLLANSDQFRHLMGPVA